MTTRSSGSKTGDSGPRRPPNSSVYPNYQQNPRPFPRLPSKGHADSANGGADSTEPSFKRQKLEERQDSLALTAPNNSQELRVSVQHSMESPTVKEDPTRSSDARGMPSLDQTLSGTQSHPFPLLPSRPSIQSHKRAKRRDAFAVERAAAKQAVQVKPYLPGPPSLAPLYPRGGMFEPGTNYQCKLM